MIRVWRFEFEDVNPKVGFNGPYCSEAMHAYERYASAHNTSSAHPAPWTDGIEWELCGLVAPKYDWVFGFRSEDQLRAWFSSKKGRVAMANKGCPPWLFDVPEGFCIFGGKQLAFVREKATRLVKLDAITLQPETER